MSYPDFHCCLDRPPRDRRAGVTPARAASQDSASAVTFHKNVLPVLQKNCQSCHRPGQIGPFSMLSYKEARPWAKAIKAAVSSRAMPPWFADPRYGHFNNDRSLKQPEIETIAAWVDSGAPEGDPRLHRPRSRGPKAAGKSSRTWSSICRRIRCRPGIIEWERIAFPSPFKEDTWVTSVEILPGVPAVVHHLCFGFRRIARRDRTTSISGWRCRGMRTEHEDGDGTTTGPLKGTVLYREAGSTEVKRREGRPTVYHEGTNEFCYLPGLPYEDYRPVDAGVFVPAGSDMIVSLHYTATGFAVVDRSRIGFTVTKTPPAKSSSRKTEPRGRIRRLRGSRPTRRWRFRRMPATIQGRWRKSASSRRSSSSGSGRTHTCAERPSVQARLSGRARRNRALCSALQLQLAAHVQDVAQDTEGVQDARPVRLRQLDGQQVQPRSRQVGLLRRSELGGNGNPEHGISDRSGRRRERLLAGTLSGFFMPNIDD